MYCEFFSEFFDEFSSPEDLTSQNISKLLANISESQRNMFYNKWSNHVKDMDFLAMDTSSISTYATLNEDADYGHPKQQSNKKLKQINVCLLFGEATGLPLFLSTYHGSINDVSAFIKCTKQYKLITDSNIKFVLDRGMFSKKNVNYMLDTAAKFIIGLPATTNLKRDLIDESIHIYKNINYSVSTAHDNIYGTSKRILLDKRQRLWAHIFINQNKHLDIHNKLQDKILQLYSEAVENPINYMNDSDYTHYLTFRKRKCSNNEYLVKKNQAVFQEELDRSGWFVFLSNEIKDTAEALTIYRKRDIVEKAFDILKNRTQERNIAVHSNRSYSNKLFIGFLSLIITSQIHKVMTEHQIYKRYTIKELFYILKSIKKISIENFTVYSALTKKHMFILDKFGCPYPLDNNRQ
jgi:transposase